MKILYHHRTRAEDAQGIHIEEIQRAFRGLGHEVLEVALIPRGGAQSAPATGGSRTKPSRIARGVSASAAMLPRAGYEAAEIASNAVEAVRLVAAARRFRPAVIYERYSLHNAAGVLAARAARVPLVLEVNAPLAAERAQHGGLSFPRVASHLEAWIWSHADAIVTVSTPLADAIAAAPGVEREKILVVPNAVRRELLDETRNGAAVRARHRIPESAVVFGFTGWFRPWHGLEGMLTAFADARLQERGARLLLVGDGQALPSLKAVARERRLEEAVVFAGAIGRDAIADHVAAFDIAMQPAATSYASPMKIFEYLALGKPVVAARTRAIAEILTHDLDSLLVPEGDAASLGSAMSQLVSDAGLRRRLSQAARETVVRRGFFWDTNAKRALEHVARFAR